MLKSAVNRTLSAVLFLGICSNMASASDGFPHGCEKGTFLRVTGKIAPQLQTSDNAYYMSEAEFLSLPVSTVTTGTPWTPRSVFAGPLLSQVLDKVGARGRKLHLVALDDFSVDVDANELRKYGTILADTKDGVRLSVRDFGPIFVMYNRDRYKAELDTPERVSDMVWQLCEIEVE